MKRLCLLTVFLLVVFPLVAEKYIIEDYSFDITGTTKEWVLRREVDPDEDEIFSDREEMLASVSEKVRGLNNRRIFKSVSYTLDERTEGETTYVRVNFCVVDAKTLLVVPYPKYDSNKGLVVAVKVLDQNIMGLLSRTESTTSLVIPPEGFGKTYYEEDFTIWTLPVGEASMYFHFDGSTKSGNFSTKIVFDTVPVGASSFNTSLSVLKKKERIQYTYNLLFFTHAGEVTFKPFLELVFNDEDFVSHILTRLETKNVYIGNTAFDFTTHYKLSAFSDYVFRSSEVKNTMLLSFRDGPLSPFSWENTVSYSFGSHIDVSNTLSWQFTSSTSFHLSEKMRFFQDGTSRFDTGMGIRERIDIGSSFSITPEFMEYIRMEKDGDGLSFSHYCTISASCQNDKVEWQDTFRTGSKWKIEISESWFQNFTSRRVNEEEGIYDYAEIESHWIVSSWFNPSIRIIASLTDDTEEHGSLKGGSLGEYIRGVLNSTVTGEERESNIFNFVLNSDFLFRLPLPSSFDWASLFLNPFFDFVWTRHSLSSRNGRGWLGFGLEIVGVLTDYPAYPLRISIGFDGEKLVKYLQGESNSRSFYEIFMGTDFLF